MFLWRHFECLVVQDGLLYKQKGPLVDGSSLVKVYVPATLRKEVIQQCHNEGTVETLLLLEDFE